MDTSLSRGGLRPPHGETIASTSLSEQSLHTEDVQQCQTLVPSFESAKAWTDVAMRQQ